MSGVTAGTSSGLDHLLQVRQQQGAGMAAEVMTVLAGGAAVMSHCSVKPQVQGMLSNIWQQLVVMVVVVTCALQLSQQIRGKVTEIMVMQLTEVTSGLLMMIIIMAGEGAGLLVITGIMATTADTSTAGTDLEKAGVLTERRTGRGMSEQETGTVMKVTEIMIVMVAGAEMILQLPEVEQDRIGNSQPGVTAEV